LNPDFGQSHPESWGLAEIVPDPESHTDPESHPDPENPILILSRDSN